MKRDTWQRPAAGPETGLSLFLILYVLGLLGVLLGVHVLQPEREDVRSASRAAAYGGELLAPPVGVGRESSLRVSH